MDLVCFELFHPCNIIISGASGAGKTTAVANLLERRNEILSERIDRIIYVFSEFQPIYSRLQASIPGIIFTNSVKDLQTLDIRSSIIVIDDKISSMGKGEDNEIITSLFTVRGHHLHATIVLITQNIFHKNMREASISVHYLLLLDQPRDKSSYMVVGRQIFPGSKFFSEAYVKCVVEKPFGMLFVDLHPKNKYLRTCVRSSIFRDSDTLVYVP